jgi:hypothetical protein
MAHVSTSTVRARRLRARRSQGVVMVAPVEVGSGGIQLLVGNGLLKQDAPAIVSLLHVANLSDRINSRHSLPDKYINLP